CQQWNNDRNSALTLVRARDLWNNKLCLMTQKRSNGVRRNVKLNN
ncbi:MAG: hypothetical protein RLY17_1083, partial [Pseudomonadota bacterium]